MKNNKSTIETGGSIIAFYLKAKTVQLQTIWAARLKILHFSFFKFFSCNENLFFGKVFPQNCCSTLLLFFFVEFLTLQLARSVDSYIHSPTQPALSPSSHFSQRCRVLKRFKYFNNLSLITLHTVLLARLASSQWELNVRLCVSTHKQTRWFKEQCLWLWSVSAINQDRDTCACKAISITQSTWIAISSEMGG